MGFFVTETYLAIGVESPHIETVLSGKSCAVAKTSGASLNSSWFAILLWGKFDHLWSSNLAMTANPQLAELCFTPAIHFTFIRDCERVEATGRDKRNLFIMEKFDEAWHRSDFN